MKTDIPNSSFRLDERFGAVADAFSQNFSDGLEIGASFAAVVDGDLVVDLKGGFKDKTTDEPWTEETLTCVFSTGKAVLSFLVAREVGEGRLDYDAPVAHLWPDFAQNGKADITLAQVMSHQAGLVGFADDATPEIWLDWEGVTARIAAMAPLWPPGTAHGYHPQTVGFIVGELLKRATGKTVGGLLSDLRAQYGFQVYCGMSASDAPRAATMRKPPRAPDLGALNDYKRTAFLKPWSMTSRIPEKDMMAAEIPSSNMHADATSLTKMLYPLANDGKWPNGDAYLTPPAVDAALAERRRGDDLVLPFHLSWSAGLMRNINHHFGPSESAFGHAGFGGSCVVIDPANSLTAAYVMNKMSPHLVGDPRAVRLLDALYACL